MLRKLVGWGLIIAVVVGAVLWLRARALLCRPPEITVIDDPAQLDDLHIELESLQPESWVRKFSPRLTSGGYTLVLFRRRLPMIIDMNGRVVHSWPKVRAVGRVRLGADGSLGVIGTDHLIKEYDWDGNLIWHYQIPDKHIFPHHDLMRMENGNYLILGHEGHHNSDVLFEVDRDGQVVWEWWFTDHAAAFEAWDPDSKDPSHTNSIRELPPNRWFDEGDERFRPGNILVSARNLNTIFIIEKASGEVVWQYSKELDRQHEAVMSPKRGPGGGHILVLNNGRLGTFAYRRSRVELINPVTEEIVWQYRSSNFFTSVSGTAQHLENDNVLISSSNGGRIFEITPGRHLVWEWTPPYKPMRPERLSADHCPQLAAMPPSEKIRIKAPAGERWLDEDLYQFDLPEEVDERTVAGKMRKVLLENKGCRKLQIPGETSLRVEYGIDRIDPERKWLEGRFRVTIRAEETKTTLFETTLGSGNDAWSRGSFIPLDQYAGQTVELCLSARVVNGDPEESGLLVWARPSIQQRSRLEDNEARRARTTEREQQLRELQLKALGYAE